MAEDWKDQFTEEQLKEIRKCWKGQPPTACVGQCAMVEAGEVMWCKGCGWDDLGLPQTE